MYMKDYEQYFAMQKSIQLYLTSILVHAFYVDQFLIHVYYVVHLKQYIIYVYHISSQVHLDILQNVSLFLTVCVHCLAQYSTSISNRKPYIHCLIHKLNITSLSSVQNHFQIHVLGCVLISLNYQFSGCSSKTSLQYYSKRSFLVPDHNQTQQSLYEDNAELWSAQSDGWVGALEDSMSYVNNFLFRLILPKRSILVSSIDMCACGFCRWLLTSHPCGQYFFIICWQENTIEKKNTTSQFI